MPRSEAQLQRVREQSRERILDAALTLFARHGFERTSIRAIAEAAGISQGLMYNYFAGKEDLLREIFARSMAGVRAAGGRLPTGAPAADRIEALIRSSLTLVTSHLDFWKLSYSLRMHPALLQGAADELRGWSESVRREIDEILRTAGVTDSGAEAAALFALIDGVAQHYVMAPRRFPLREVTETVVRRYRSVVGEGAAPGGPDAPRG